MTHPTIERRRQQLLALIDRLETRLEAMPDDPALTRRVDRAERELDALDMEAADPAAHGYAWG
jgi:hypothetical protein